MKNRLIPYLIIIAALLLACGDSSDDPSIKSDNGHTYANSREAWTKLKSEKGKSYRYTTTAASFSGYRWETMITVIDDQITQRDLTEYLNEQGTERITDSYSEAGDQLGVHSKGAELKTVEELYDICANTVLIVDTTSNTLYWKTSTDGILQQCGYVPNNCADDCFTGVSIRSLVWL